MKIQKIFPILCLLLTGFRFSLRAQDHLEPVEALFDNFSSRLEYYQHIKSILLDDVDKAAIKYMVLPESEPESILFIKDDFFAHKKYLVYRVASQNIWYAEDRSKITVSDLRKEISPDVAAVVVKLFQKAVAKTAYPLNEIDTANGTHYFFSFENFGYRSGAIQAPAKGSKMFELVSIAEKLVALAQSKQATAVPDSVLMGSIRSLTAKM